MNNYPSKTMPKRLPCPHGVLGWTKCKVCTSESHKRWRARQPKSYYEKKNADGLKYYYEHRERELMGRREERQKRKEEQIRFLGGGHPKCACCGMDWIEFLSIDHINNDGSKERKNGFDMRRVEIGKLDKNRYQLLCFNCNYGKYRNHGVCPHQEEKNKTRRIV